METLIFAEPGYVLYQTGDLFELFRVIKNSETIGWTEEKLGEFSSKIAALNWLVKNT